jgi:hypothetical protein
MSLFVAIHSTTNCSDEASGQTDGRRCHQLRPTAVLLQSDTSFACEQQEQPSGLDVFQVGQPTASGSDLNGNLQVDYKFWKSNVTV